MSGFHDFKNIRCLDSTHSRFLFPLVKEKAEFCWLVGAVDGSGRHVPEERKR